MPGRAGKYAHTTLTNFCRAAKASPKRVDGSSENGRDGKREVRSRGWNRNRGNKWD
jgi:hypothetical protein